MKVKVLQSIFQTKDYSAFKILKANRAINRIAVEQLKKSFQQAYLISPITVNEEYEIIDGQHRFTAAKELGLPINFIVAEGYSLDEIQKLNTNTRPWGKKEYLHSYSESGYPEYQKMVKFMKDFPDFSMSTAEAILTNNSKGINNKRQITLNNGSKVRIKLFQSGLFEVDDLNLAYENAKKIMQIKPYYDGYFRTKFAAAMIRVFRNPEYDHEQMIARFEANPGMMEDRNNIDQYLILIEDLYNYRSRNKVSLRFS
jgi:hypothetical protein